MLCRFGKQNNTWRVILAVCAFQSTWIEKRSYAEFYQRFVPRATKLKE